MHDELLRPGLRLRLVCSSPLLRLRVRLRFCGDGFVLRTVFDLMLLVER